MATLAHKTANKTNSNPNARFEPQAEATRRRAGLMRASWVVLLAPFLINPISAQTQQDYFNATDGNGDGKVSLAEFQQSLRYAFDRIDTNQNDVIDADEALVPRMRGMTRARQQRNIAAQFGRQDKNRNGSLSVAELTEPY